MEWFKTYQDGVLRGSLSTTNNTTQLIWLKFLAIENETRLRDGWLHYAKGKPMSREYLATVCNVTVEELNVAITEFLGDIDKDGHARIEIDNGDIYIKNWEKYQARAEKVIKKQAAIDKAKNTKRGIETATKALLTAANTANIINKNLANKANLAITQNGIVDKKTGEIIE
jgi:hypothetical protein